MSPTIQRPPPRFPPIPPFRLPADPAELATAVIAEAKGNLEEAYHQAAALAIVARELGDELWLSRARMALLIIRRRFESVNRFRPRVYSTSQ